MPPFPSMLMRAATVACLVLLVACGKKPPAAPAAPGTASPSASKTPAATNTSTSSAPPIAAVTSPRMGAAVATSSAMAARRSSALAGAASGPASASSASANAPIKVIRLTLGSTLDASYQVTQPADSFVTDDKNLYAQVDTTGRTDGATLVARWSYLEGKGQLVSNVSQTIAAQGPATTSFQVHNPDLWPSGKYQVEILLDGKPVEKKGFAITGQ